MSNSIDTIPPEENAPVIESKDQPSWLDRSLVSLTTWNWEKAAWTALLIVALVIRVVALNNRTASHDESEHAWFAYNLFTGAGYQHSPVYHGPFAYHVLALFYLLFGVSDVTARLPTALFGVGIVWLIWFMRPWIGRFGAFFAALMVTISPALLHYARHTRHDTFEIFFAVLLLIAVFRYLADNERSAHWLYIGAAALSFMLAIKEVAFIDGAVLGLFLVLVILYRWQGWRLKRDYPDEEREAPLASTSRSDWLVLVGGIVLSMVGVAVFRLLGLADAGADALNTGIKLAVLIAPPLIAIVMAGLYVRRRENDEIQPAFGMATDAVVLLATLILPWLSPFLIKALGYDPLNYTTGIMASFSVVAALVGVAAVVGLLWNARRWLVAAAIFTGIFVVFFTTFFTNGQGVATGVVGSLGHWLSQQEVARGGQPWYYYLLVTPLYEFLPLLLSIPVLFRAFVQRNRVSIVLLIATLVSIGLWLGLGVLRGEGGTESSLVNDGLRAIALMLIFLTAAWGGLNAHARRGQYFVAFLPFLILFNWIAYTIAGEKMPWLVTHISLPMCIAGGYWLGTVVERVEWRTAWRRGALWAGLLTVVFIAALMGVLRSQPFQDRSLAGLSNTSQWLAALVVGGVTIFLLAKLAGRLGTRTLLRISGLTVVLLLGLWTVRTSYALSFINQNYVNEYLFYAHASPDPLMDMREIEDISRRTVGDKQLRIAYDDDASWPFNWYLSTWPNAAYFGATPSREAFADAPVALVGSKNLDQARPYLARDYYEFDRRLIWWPNEDYKNVTWDKIKLGITDPTKRREFLDVVLWRKFTTPMSQWPLVHRYSLFVRKDVANELWDFGAEPAAFAPIVDPYEQGMREVAASQIIGFGQGVSDGQLNTPRNMAVAADGTIYVADSGNHRIQAFAADGTPLRSWGTSCELYTDGQPGCVDPDGSGPLQVGDGQMREPWGIAIGPDGNIYVADTWNHRVIVFDPDGNFVRKWGTFVTTNGEAVGGEGGFWGPRAIAFDAVGNLYVTDTGNKRVQVFDSDGGFLGQYGGGGVVPGRFDEPVGLALLPNAAGAPGGTLFVADTWNRRVQVFDVTFTDNLSGGGGAGRPEFTFVREWPIEGWSSQSVVNKPYLAVDTEGYVYVTDPELWRVLVFDQEGNFKATFGVFGNDNQSFALPNGVAIGPDNQVYVADADNHRVMVFPAVR
ncbi:MAG: TIGR03663 family protein [Anaerolineae bacterium]|nr:TIGR03663 family protein [Anaerolineae bacterium]